MVISGLICWRLSCSRQFDTRSYYKVFRGNWDYWVSMEECLEEKGSTQDRIFWLDSCIRDHFDRGQSS